MLTQDEEQWAKELPPGVEELLSDAKDPVADRSDRSELVARQINVRTRDEDLSSLLPMHSPSWCWREARQDQGHHLPCASQRRHSDLRLQAEEGPGSVRPGAGDAEARRAVYSAQVRLEPPLRLPRYGIDTPINAPL